MQRRQPKAKMATSESVAWRQAATESVKRNAAKWRWRRVSWRNIAAASQWRLKLSAKSAAKARKALSQCEWRICSKISAMAMACANKAKA